MMPGAIFIEGEKVNLRTLEEEDLGFIRDTYNHPEVRRFVSNWEPQNLEQERDFFENVVSNDEEGVQLLVCREGEPMGMVGLHPLEQPNVMEIGLSLHPDFHGNGYGTESAKLMVEHGFNELGLHRIKARAMENNEGSNRIWEKLGFEKEGTLREDMYHEGEYHDTNVYGLLEQEWES